MIDGGARVWEFRSLQGGPVRRAELVAFWEVQLDPISDDYTPNEISADDLFGRWVAKVEPETANGLVPIYWSVGSPERGGGIFEQMPFQFPHFMAEDFLTRLSWPVDSRTGERLNWLTLHVVDKRWNKSRADKGGFIQEATGWKPSILQPYVYLGSLTRSRG